MDDVHVCMYVHRYVCTYMKSDNFAHPNIATIVNLHQVNEFVVKKFIHIFTDLHLPKNRLPYYFSINSELIFM